MFYNQLPLSNSPLTQLSKRQHFRLQIRSRQIEQIKKQIRFKYYQLKDPNDYQLLRTINLTKILNQSKNNGLTQDRVHAMFLYASSRNSDHLFSIMDQSVLEILINNLIHKYQVQVQVQVHGQGQNKCTRIQKQCRLGWDRKIFWILTNYTSYQQIIHNQYLTKLEIISKYLFTQQHSHNTNDKHPKYSQQTQQNIILSLSNMFIKSKNCRYILQNYRQLVYTIMQHIINRKPSLPDMIIHSIGNINKLVYYYCQLLHNLYITIQYTQIQQQVQVRLVKLVIKIMQALFYNNNNSNNSNNNNNHNNNSQCIIISEQNKNIILILVDSLCKLFGNTFDRYPHIILQHIKEIKKLCNIFEKFVKTQKQSAKSDQIIVAYLIFLRILYGPNIPQEIQNKVGIFYLKHFQNHVDRVCQLMFLTKNPLFHTYTLQLLQSILMQQYLAQQIFNQYLPIISHIFYHIKNSSYPLRRQSLLCIINLLKSTLYQQSSCKQKVLQILLANKISDILAINLWAFVDNDLNLQLLLGIQMLLQAQKNQYGAKLQFWEMFTEAGGTLKMEKMLEETGMQDIGYGQSLTSRVELTDGHIL